MFDWRGMSSKMTFSGLRKCTDSESQLFGPSNDFRITDGYGFHDIACHGRANGKSASDIPMAR
jgi:hypothetical protein